MSTGTARKPEPISPVASRTLARFPALLPGIHGHQKKTLALFVLGTVLSGNAVMQRVAETVSERGLSGAKMTSIERRLEGFLANSHIVVPLMWKLFLEQVLTPFRGHHLYFVLDNTSFRNDLTIVYLGLLIHSRVLPVAWAVMPAQTKWDEGQWQIVGRLLDQVRVHLPETPCTVIADRGLAGNPLVQLCTARGWHYLLRVCAEHTCRRYIRGKLERGWKLLDHIVLKRSYRWYGRARVWQEETLETWISLVWHPAYEEPWLLTSDEGTGHTSPGIRQADARRSHVSRLQKLWAEHRSQLDHPSDAPGSLAAGSVSRCVVSLAFSGCLYP